MDSGRWLDLQAPLPEDMAAVVRTTFGLSDEPQAWPAGYHQQRAGYWFSHPREGRCREGQQPSPRLADEPAAPPCTWRRAPLALSLRMQDLYHRGWNASYDPRQQYDVPLEQVQQNAAVLEAAFADVAASHFAGGGRSVLHCAIE